MSKPKIKPAKRKQSRKAHAIGHVLNMLENHLEHVPLVVSYLAPPVTPEEYKESTFLAEAIFSELEKKYGSRMKMIVSIFMYERVIGGVVKYLSEVKENEKSVGKESVAAAATAAAKLAGTPAGEKSIGVVDPVGPGELLAGMSAEVVCVEEASGGVDASIKDGTTEEDASIHGAD